MRQLLLSQLELARRMGVRLEVAAGRRAHLLEMLQSLWAQLIELQKASASDPAVAREISQRIRALCAASEEQGGEMREAAPVSPLPGTHVPVAPPAT